MGIPVKLDGLGGKSAGTCARPAAGLKDIGRIIRRREEEILLAAKRLTMNW